MEGNLGDISMNKEFLDKLIEYIDASIQAEAMSYSSDGGLAESLKADKLKSELYELLKNENHTI
jgi:predicted house-cleaning noncanonical NTP pyrophosphatase (MazG superfamily)